MAAFRITWPTAALSSIFPDGAESTAAAALASTSPPVEVIVRFPVSAVTAAPSVAVPVEVTVTPVPPATAPLSVVVPPEVIVVAFVEVKSPAATLPTVAVSVITSLAIIVCPVVVTLPVEDVTDTAPPVEVRA